MRTYLLPIIWDHERSLDLPLERTKSARTRETAYFALTKATSAAVACYCVHVHAVCLYSHVGCRRCHAILL